MSDRPKDARITVDNDGVESSSVQFGLNFFPCVSPAQKSGEQYFREAMHLCSLTDELGYTHIRQVEHYFKPYGGYSPNPLTFLTAAAMCTRNTRLITGAILPAFNHPLKLAGEVGMVDGEYFLALEYVEGRDLRRIIAELHGRSEKLPLDLALWIVREIASGLAYAHRKKDTDGRPLNGVHCDGSPPNNTALSRRVVSASVTRWVRETSSSPGSLKPMCPLEPIPRICKRSPPTASISPS